MRKVIFGYGFADTYQDLLGYLKGANVEIVEAPKHVDLVEIPIPEEVAAYQKYIAEMVAAGKRHPIPRPKAV